MIKFDAKARVLSAEAKPYNFDGRSGTSYKARVLIDSDIFPLKCDEAGITALQPYVGKDVDISVELSAPKENVRLTFAGIKQKA